MVKSISVCVVFIVLLGTSGCDWFQTEKDEPEETPVDPMVEVQLHVQTFLDEAEQRGRTGVLYNPSALQIFVQEEVVINGDELCGYGGANPDTDQPEIFISTEANCWDRSTHDKEILVFHELGHAFLGRGHREEEMPNGLRISIMVGGNIFGLYSQSLLDRRLYYIDELFDTDTPVPPWGF